MRKTEAAEIIANFVVVQARKHGVKVIDKTFIAECISVARYEREEGSPLNQAGWLRPSDQLIKQAGRRMA